MGEIADWINEQGEEEEIAQTAYHMGLMTDLEAMERGILDEDGYEHWYTLKPLVCKYCGKKNLHWIRVPEGWRVGDKRGLHQCPHFKIKTEDLDKWSEPCA